MLGLRSVASFAGNHHVLALFFLLDHIDMASLARVVAGEGHGPGRDLSDGVAAIMSVLPKTAGNDGGSQNDECDHCDCHDGREPDEMFDVFKQFVRLLRARAAQRFCAMLLDT